MKSSIAETRIMRSVPMKKRLMNQVNNRNEQRKRIKETKRDVINIKVPKNTESPKTRQTTPNFIFFFIFKKLDAER